VNNKTAKKQGERFEKPKFIKDEKPKVKVEIDCKTSIPNSNLVKDAEFL